MTDFDTTTTDTTTRTEGGNTYFTDRLASSIDFDQRRVLAAVAALALFLGAIAGVLFILEGPSPDLEAAGPEVGAVDETNTTAVENINDATANEADGPIDPEGELPAPTDVMGVNTGSAGGSSGGSIEPVDVGTGAGATSPADECAAVLAEGENLLVRPLDLQLDSGRLDSELTITNCGDEAVDWTALTKPFVTLGNDSGNLAPGSTSVLSFDIDSGAYEPGAFEFKIKVSEPGSNTYVDIAGWRPTFGSEQQIEPVFTSGGATGCEKQCIVKAWLTPNLVNANVNLDVALTVPAHLKVWVSEGSIVTNGLGNPVFPGVAPVVNTSDVVETWAGTLGPLSHDTDYNIIVKAIDENGKASFQSGSFTTRSPLDNPGDYNAGDGVGGCNNQCITQALVTTTSNVSVMTLDTITNVPTQLAVFVSTDEPSTAALGWPYFPGEPPVIETNTLTMQHSFELGTLAPATTYYLIVEATDEHGNQAVQSGSFETEPLLSQSVRITLHKIHVREDGDPSWHNRGELSFTWQVDGDEVAYMGERKIDDGDWLDVPDALASYTLHDVPRGGFLPMIHVIGSERDADLRTEFCSSVVSTIPGSNGDCDNRWNVASSGFMTLDSIEGLESCAAFHSSFQFSDLSCIQLTTVNQPGDQWAEFDVIVSVEILD